MGKKDIRKNFRDSVFKRDKWTCQVCGEKQLEKDLDAHHITDRSEMPNGGYVKENGITVCKNPIGLITIDGDDGLPDFEWHDKSCHFKVERFHITEGEEWNDGLHPDDLYKIIGSSRKLAETKSNEL